MTAVSDIIAHMEYLAPRHLAESWDNPGLQVGSPEWRVEKVLVSLDPTPEVVADACEQGADLLLTHHPFLFRAVKQIDCSTPLGRMIETAISHHLAIFSAHTNLDWVSGGLNDVLSEKIGLKNVSALRPRAEEEAADGQGRIGTLDEPPDLAGLARTVKSVLGLAALRVVGDLKMPVERVAVCTGGGSGLLEAFFSSCADVFVSGDLRYHEARDAQLYQRGLIDAGHFGTEHLMVDLIRRRLASGLADSGHEVDVLASGKEADPFVCF
ncbi:MAG: Nif3-like dinuclear metal center hexameric protein [Desulfosalsimonadaceae bacterium]